MTKGSDNSPKQNRPNQDDSWQDAQSQNDNLNNSNRHNNNPPYEGSPETRSNPKASQGQNQSGNNQNQNQNTGAGVSGRPNHPGNDSSIDSKNPPKFQDGSVAGGADNTRGENVPSREGYGAGAKEGKFDPETKSPQGSNANWSDTRGADSSDKEFKNNQPNASTLEGYRGDASLADDVKDAKREE
jgi:hypothetical protein